jgi:peptide/nickel transport system permease protein
MLHFIPGDPAAIMAGEAATSEDIAQLRQNLNLDKPLYVQYWTFISNAFMGNLGESLRTYRKVSDELAVRFPRTMVLALASLIVAISVGLPSGIISATRQYSFFDYSSMLISILGVSMPTFWSGLLAMYIFSVRLGWFPTAGAETLRHVVLPAVTLGFSAAAIIARLTRSTMLEVLRNDYIRTARSKGMAERQVIWKHALKNAMIPTVTIIGLRFGYLLAGAVVTETVFAYPGVGLFLVESIRWRDYPVVQACVLLIATSFVLVNLIVDLTYGLLDPRIREKIKGS